MHWIGTFMHTLEYASRREAPPDPDRNATAMCECGVCQLSRLHFICLANIWSKWNSCSAMLRLPNIVYREFRACAEGELSAVGAANEHSLLFLQFEECK